MLMGLEYFLFVFIYILVGGFILGLRNTSDKSYKGRYNRNLRVYSHTNWDFQVKKTFLCLKY